MEDNYMEKIDYKIIIVFVGLPASGKSYTSTHIKQYLTWLGYNISIFNCGNYRRLLSGGNQSASFFDHTNEYNMKIREQFFYSAMFDLNTFLKVKNGDIGILDATNTTKNRRKKNNKFFFQFQL